MVPICTGTGWIRACRHQVLPDPILHATSRNVRAHGSAGCAECGRPADNGHVSAVAAGYSPATRRLIRAGAAYNFCLSDRFCSGPDYLWTRVPPARPTTGFDRGDLPLLRGTPRLGALGDNQEAGHPA